MKRVHFFPVAIRFWNFVGVGNRDARLIGKHGIKQVANVKQKRINKNVDFFELS